MPNSMGNMTETEMLQGTVDNLTSRLAAANIELEKFKIRELKLIDECREWAFMHTNLVERNYHLRVLLENFQLPPLHNCSTDGCKICLLHSEIRAELEGNKCE